VRNLTWKGLALLPTRGCHTDTELGSRPRADGDVRRQRIVWADDSADMREYVRRLLRPRYDVDGDR
jgi:hypothetical protein